MRVLLKVSSGPFVSDISRAAYQLALGLLNEGHQLWIFFDGNGVLNFQPHMKPASGEANLSKLWLDLPEKHSDISLNLCSAAAQRRGIQVDTSSPLSISSLIDFHEQRTQSDRVLCLGNPHE